MQIHQQALAQATSPATPEPEVVILPQSFAESVQAYDNAVQTVVTASPATIENSRGPLTLLAMAIERTPGASEVDGAGAAALMRADLEALASPRAAGDVRPALHALRIATDFFLVLARGPYAAFPEVRRRADDLAMAIHEVPSSRAPTAADLAPPLRAASGVLDAVRLAAAETRSPPPL
jgi:hypothetical protein